MKDKVFNIQYSVLRFTTDKVYFPYLDRKLSSIIAFPTILALVLVMLFLEGILFLLGDIK